MKKIIEIGIICLILGGVGCSTQGGYEARVSTASSGTREVAIVPHAACTSAADSCPISVGASWSSSAPEDAAISISLSGQSTVLKELQINIDGDRISLYPDKTTRRDRVGSSKQYFATKLNVVKYIVESKKTWIKAISTDGTYIEAPVIDSGHDTYAFNALKRFLYKAK